MRARGAQMPCALSDRANGAALRPANLAEWIAWGGLLLVTRRAREAWGAADVHAAFL